MTLSGQNRYEKLRREYPAFTYEGFKTALNSEGLTVTYHFNLSEKYHFRPGFKIPAKTFLRKLLKDSYIQSEKVQDLLFHIGMIELVSYWKTTCSPQLIIRDRNLTDEQVAFWKKTYFFGLGEFFYVNKIEADLNDFITFTSGTKVYSPSVFNLSDAVIVPIGGGKDSVVTLELLKDEMEVRPFILNPRKASLDTCYKAGFAGNTIAEAYRWLDPVMLKMNSEGFLNGHTPFSALLAFYTLLIASLTGYRHIALSNESSANEPTVSNTLVNHQYSKSVKFESDFREYVNRFISSDFNYFSFLRPLNELQIAMIFSRHVKYYSVFKSCNVGSKTDIWCGHCPKCLFAWIILCPFIPINELTYIFGKNLFEDPTMIPYLKELTGMEEIKPFECVGTIDEVNTALQLFLKKHPHEKYPLLIDYYSNTSSYFNYSYQDHDILLKGFEPQHFLEDSFLSIIHRALS